MPAALLIVAEDRPVPEAAGRWKAGQVILVNDELYTSGGEANTDIFVQFWVTDKTPEEVDAKLFAPYNMDIDMTVVAGPDPTGRRRIYVRNNNTNSTGTKGGWTTEMTDNIEEDWNYRYPDSNLETLGVLTGTNPGDTWDCAGTFEPDQYNEFEDTIVQIGSEALNYRRLWYINETGLDNIKNNGGVQEGTAQQLSNWLEDYRVTT